MMTSEQNSELSGAMSAQPELLELTNKKTMKLKIQGKEIRASGYPEGPVVSIAFNVTE